MRYDLTRSNEARAMIEEVVGEFGRLNILVNVVGPFLYRDITEMTPEEWRETIALNLHTCFNRLYRKPISDCRTVTASDQVSDKV